jgi:predicted RNA-binding protein with RPS1 domain
VIDFFGYLSRTREADDLPRAEVQKIEARCREGLGVADILERHGGENDLPAAHVRRVHDAFLRFEIVRRAAEPHRGRVPDDALDDATAPHQVDALDRALEVVGTDVARLRAALGVWTRSLAMARRDGEVQVDVVAGHPGAAEFGDEARVRARLEGLAAHRWLRWRRGERDGALTRRLVLPLAAIEAHARTALRHLAAGEPQRVLERVVVAELPAALLRMLDDWAGADAIRSAQNVFLGVLRTPKLDAERIGAVFLGDGLGACVLDRAGQTVDSIVTAELAEVAALFDRHSVEAVVLPTRAADAAKLTQAQRRLGKDRGLQQVSPAGLGEARKGIDLPSGAASAVVLARRALDPVAEWTRVDPLRLGLAEYQQDLDEDKLRAAYAEALRLARAETLRSSMPRPAPTASAAAQTLVKRVDDLRPGMMVQGVVTSITSFGAFVNLGLSDEGLVHVSELADRFVDDPATVVSVGQPVLAKVLGVDRGRRRISLSLRREERPARERGGGAASHGAKSQALSDLERLFKKS